MALTVSHDLQALHDYSKRAMIDLISCHSKEGTWDISGDSVAPPPYSEEERSRIPDPEIFAKTETRRLSADSNGSLAFCQLPSVSQCATHLELLQAFYALRAQVLGSTELDKLFDIKPESPMATRKLKEIGLQDRYLGEKKRSKWPLFVDFAVVRFQIWAKRVDPMLVDPYEKKKGGGKGNNDADVLLAPLDILMIWHSFLLNPRTFYAYCQNQRLIRFAVADFPWQGIHDAISPVDYSFTHPLHLQALFRDTTELEPNFFKFLSGSKFSSRVAAVLRHPRFFHQHELDQLLSEKKKSKVLPLTDWEAGLLRCVVQIHVHRRTEITRQLAGMVERQASFVDKMQGQLWLHSPAIGDTLQRAVDRYGKFLKMFKWYPNEVIVPTLDIDLVWHTHQCSPARYHEDTVSVTGRFINHDDTIAKDTLGAGLERTKMLFRTRFGQEYLTCTCWDCEATLSAVTQLNREGADESKLEGIGGRVSRDIAYYRAAEVARRCDRSLPIT